MSNFGLAYDLKDGVGAIRLTQPELLNRIDRITKARLTEQLDSIRRSRDVRVVLIHAEGDTFSSGGDLDEVDALLADPEEQRQAWPTGRWLMDAMNALPQPVVVALTGDALGLGATLAFSADLVVADRQARIGDPHVRVGLAAGGGGCVVWPAAIGLFQSRAPLLLGAPMSAERAFELGAISDLVAEPEQVLPRAWELCRRLADLPAAQVRARRLALAHIAARRTDEVFEYSLALAQLTMRSEDIATAMAGFRNRRRMTYRGR